MAPADLNHLHALRPMRLEPTGPSSVNCIRVRFQLCRRWMSHDVTSCSDGQEVGRAAERVSKKSSWIVSRKP